MPEPRADTEVRIAELSEELLEQWQAEGRASARDLRSALKHHIVPAFGSLAARELRPEYVAAWVQALLAEGLAPKTTRKLVSFLSSVLALAVSGRILEANPVQLLPRGALPSNRPRDPTRAALETLSVDQVAELLGACGRLPDHEWVFFCVLLLTGARFGEAAALRWRDVSRGHAVRIERSWDCKGRVEGSTKTGIVRHVPMSTHLGPVLDTSAELTRARRGHLPGPDDLVCPYAEKHWWRRWSSSTANRRWKAAQVALGWTVPPTGPRAVKATRHTFTTLCRRAGGDIASVHMITHASEPDSRTSARVYTHLDFADLEAVVARLDASLSSAMEAPAP